MKVTEYTSELYEGKIFSKEFNLDDLIEGITEFDTAIVKKIVMDFLTRMVLDLIDTNDYFLFPIPNFAYITVTDISNVGHIGYTYDVFKGTDCNFQPVIQGEGLRKTVKITGMRYIVRFLGETQKYFQEVINSGHHY